MEDCLFCRIASGEIPSDKVYEDDRVLAFRDIAPQAPVHVLVIPKKHIRDAGSVGPGDGELIAHIFEVVGILAGKLGIAEDGYRIVSNVGKFGQQSVPHLHLHVMGGRQMTWPAG